MTTSKKEMAVFGGGCFWCTEAVYQMLKGVISVEPGYAGGETKNPTYEGVSSGRTGHAEAIRIEFDPSQISYKDLLTVFFASHDPTTPNRQGADIGTQYRSIILYIDEKQRKEAVAFIEKINDEAGEKIVVTEIKPFENFYPAEAYHRNYYQQNSWQPYCQAVINPKLKKVKEQFAKLLKNQ